MPFFWNLESLASGIENRSGCRPDQRATAQVHPELAFGAMAGTPLVHSKHTAAGRELRRQLLELAGIVLPRVPRAPVTDTLDAAAVAWSAWRIATGQAVVVPARPQRDDQGREIAIRY